MQYLINEFLRILVKISLKGYFNKIVIEGKENIPKNTPILLVANHQNALIDPLLLATHTGLKPSFLTRASVFKKSFVAKLLNFIHMLPVYRVRDGFSTIQQNQTTFDQTYEVLQKNGTVIIFAEGSHSLIRNLRPLSKGFTRIIFGALEQNPELDLTIIPVGLNYAKAEDFAESVAIHYGKPLAVKDFLKDGN